MTGLENPSKYQTLVSALTLLFGLTIAMSSVSASPEIPLDAWVPTTGDRLIVDTKENVGYLVRENGDYARFDVLTGQRRYVRYIGRTYFAATPEKLWTVKSVEVKGRSMTFGETGTFLRLYDGDERTAYGIHSHLTFQKMLDEGDRYRSMGCVLVSESVLRLLVKTTELNGGTLDVATKHGVDVEQAAPTIAEKPSWLGL